MHAVAAIGTSHNHLNKRIRLRPCIRGRTGQDDSIKGKMLHPLRLALLVSMIGSATD